MDNVVRIRAHEGGTMIVTNAEDMKEVLAGRVKHLSFIRKDTDVFNGLGLGESSQRIPGLAFRGPDTPESLVEPVHVQVQLTPVADPLSANPPRNTAVVAGVRCLLAGRVWDHGRCEEHNVEVVPVRQDIFSRSRGLLETDVLAPKSVLITALGSVGATVARQIAQLGVCRIGIMDPERIEVSNVARHEARLSDVGRRKTSVVKELILDKNPHAEVETYDWSVCTATFDDLVRLMGQYDLAIATMDNRGGKQMTSKAGLLTDTPVIISGAFRRAYGGLVIRVLPGVSACYECFVRTLRHDTRFAGGDPDPNPIAYSDRPVPIEPGLALDIAPICHMTTKVALQQLLRDVPTTFRSLDEDLAANLYLWLNRREIGTPFERLEPLGFGVDGLRILGWYGVDLPKDPNCPICGNYAGYLAALHGIEIGSDDPFVGNASSTPEGNTHG